MLELAQIEYGNKVISVTISIRIKSMSGEESLSKNDMIRMADKALYHAKNSGKNRCQSFERISTTTY